MEKVFSFVSCSESDYRDTQAYIEHLLKNITINGTYFNSPITLTGKMAEDGSTRVIPGIKSLDRVYDANTLRGGSEDWIVVGLGSKSKKLYFKANEALTGNLIFHKKYTKIK